MKKLPKTKYPKQKKLSKVKFNKPKVTKWTK